MKLIRAITGPFTIMILLLCSLVLVVLTGLLYRRNQSFASENRTLIIANDSIMSVNIHLHSALQSCTQARQARAVR